MYFVLGFALSRISISHSIHLHTHTLTSGGPCFAANNTFRTSYYLFRFSHEQTNFHGPRSEHSVFPSFHNLYEFNKKIIKLNFSLIFNFGCNWRPQTTRTHPRRPLFAPKHCRFAVPAFRSLFILFDFILYFVLHSFLSFSFSVSLSLSTLLFLLPLPFFVVRFVSPFRFSPLFACSVQLGTIFFCASVRFCYSVRANASQKKNFFIFLFLSTCLSSFGRHRTRHKQTKKKKMRPTKTTKKQIKIIYIFCCCSFRVARITATPTLLPAQCTSSTRKTGF